MWLTAAKNPEGLPVWADCPVNWLRKTIINFSEFIWKLINETTSRDPSDAWSTMITRRQAIKAWLIFGAITVWWSTIAFWNNIFLEKKVEGYEVDIFRKIALDRGTFIEKKAWDKIILNVSYTDQKNWFEFFESYECVEIVADWRVLSEVAADFYNSWSTEYQNWHFWDSDIYKYMDLTKLLNNERLDSVVRPTTRILVPIQRTESKIVYK